MHYRLAPFHCLFSRYFLIFLIITLAIAPDTSTAQSGFNNARQSLPKNKAATKQLAQAALGHL